jgi:hypothetical protein
VDALVLCYRKSDLPGQPDWDTALCPLCGHTIWVRPSASLALAKHPNAKLACANCIAQIGLKIGNDKLHIRRLDKGEW